MKKIPDVFAFIDESELKLPRKEKNSSARINYVYAVGAVVIEGRDSLDGLLEKLADLREEAVHDPSIEHHEESARLASSGWHLTEDQISSAVPLWQFMGNSVDIKHHYRYFESSEKIDGSKLSRVYAVLHATVVRDLLQRYKTNPSIEFNFEEFTDLNSKFESLVKFCAKPNRRFRPSTPTVNVVSKGDSDISSIADYMILGISRLIAHNEIACEKIAMCLGNCRAHLFEPKGSTLGHLDSKDFNFRNFENIRGSLSSAYSVRINAGVLS